MLPRQFQSCVVADTAGRRTGAGRWGTARSRVPRREHAAQEPQSQRVVHTTRGRFDLQGAVLDYAGASVGVATIGPDQHLRVEDALRVADRTMYQVKQARRQAQDAVAQARSKAAHG